MFFSEVQTSSIFSGAQGFLGWLHVMVASFFSIWGFPQKNASLRNFRVHAVIRPKPGGIPSFCRADKV